MKFVLSCLRDFLCIAAACVAVFDASAAGVTPELQKKMRAATFEVVRKKPQSDPLTYEKPLPLELLPYIERNDAYQSIGTAFALGRNTYVTAGHVLLPSIDSQFGPPALRAADGKVYAIDKILKFSADRDFAVFSLANDPDPSALEVNRTPQIDDTVVAVGNALGEGIVIRDGLFTSETPEDQDGRWKWIRFSAAASPGNSGGPLLDVNGRVIGIVIGKSPNENLNFSLPIAIVLDAPAGKATLDVRSMSSLDFLQGHRAYRMQSEFRLPLSWSEFSRKYLEEIRKHGDLARGELIAAFADTLFPKGAGSDRVLSDVSESSEPRLIVQGDDDKLQIVSPLYRQVDLAADGFVKVGAYRNILAIQLRRSGHVSDAAFYSDSKLFMDDALKALNLARDVGPDRVKITSLNKATSERLFTDAYGRKWQQRIWPVPFLDAYLVVTLLPAPDGYQGLVAFTPGVLLHEVQSNAELIANQFVVSYFGTIEQWRVFLRQKHLLPDALADLKLDTAPDWRVQSGQFHMTVPKSVLELSDSSRMDVRMAYMGTSKGVVWRTGGISIYRDDREKAFASLWRAVKPASDASAEDRNRFSSMRNRTSPYDSRAIRETSDTFRIETALDVPSAKANVVAGDVIYGLTLQLDAYPSMAQMAERQESLRRMVDILERAQGEEVKAFVPAKEADSPPVALPSLSPQLQALSMVSGSDGRGKTLVDDIAALTDAVNSKGATEQSMAERLQMLQEYWESVKSLNATESAWTGFVDLNHLPKGDSAYGVIALAKYDLKRVLSAGTLQRAWIDGTQKLTAAYLQEKKRQTTLLVAKELAPDAYTETTKPCSLPASATSNDLMAKSFRFQTPTPDYPPSSRRAGEEGPVVLSLRVDAQGCLRAKGILVSSGFAALDEAALRWIETVEFLPGEREGKAIESEVKFQVNFKLKD